MISDKEKQIRDSLDNKEYRDALAIEHVNTTLAIQIRKMRESQPWTQTDLATRLGKHQETISEWENPDYGRYSITTLKKLASIFDVALLVKFIPFSELVEDMVNLTDNRLSPPSYKEEQSPAVSSALMTNRGEVSIYIDASNGVRLGGQSHWVGTDLPDTAGTISIAVLPDRLAVAKDAPTIENEKELAYA